MKNPSGQLDHFVQNGLPPKEQWPELVYEFSDHLQIEHINLVTELLDKKADDARLGSRPLLRSTQKTMSYRDVQCAVNQIANVLVQDFGLQSGERVLLRGSNSIGLALCWLAVVKAGLIAVATMPLLRAAELSGVIAKAKPRLALCDAGLADELLKAQINQPELGRVVLFDACFLTEGDEGHAGHLPALANKKSAVFKTCATAATDVALMAFTSGTTGQPKAAVHTHRDVLAACESWPRFVLEATPNDVVIGSPPLAFTFGLGGLLIFPMWAGASVYFHHAPYTPQSFVEVVNSTKATICYTAPTFYRQIAALVKDVPMPSLRLSVSAGEALPDATRQLWKQATGLEMLDGIGATEMFHIFISSKGDAIRRGAIGQVVPGYIARILDDAGAELPRGTIGKLAVKGPTGCRYFSDERQLKYVKNGWNYPGDTFVQDEDGYFFYQARDDDMIITAGYNVGAPEVEDALLKHPLVAECGVVGDADEERGMVIHAYCVLKQGCTPDDAMKKTLQDHVKASIAPFKYPRRITFLDKLPRTETGKLQRFKLRNTHA